MLSYVWNLIANKPIWNSNSILSLIMIYVPFAKQVNGSMALDFFLRSFRISSDLFMEIIGLKYWPKRRRLAPITDPLLLQSATELVGQIRSGKLKSEILTCAYIKRIREVNPQLNAMVNDCFEQAIAEAKAIDVRIEKALSSSSTKSADNVLNLPLLGIPMTIKESISVKGQPSSAGLCSRKNIRMTEDAPVVKRLRDAGAIIVGVTNIPEFLLWWDSSNRLYGRTNNPHDLSRISGGSSGGEGALLSAAGSLVGLGSDIGGSIRIPSIFCGIFGHKPSSNIVPLEGNFPYCGHPDREKYLTTGPMCRYAIDMRLILKQIVNNPAALRLDESVDLSRCKFYFLTHDGDPMKTKTSDDVVDAINRARAYLTELGFACHDADLPLMRYSFFIWLTSIADVDSPKLACELMERKGELNGWLELVKGMTIGSNYRRITCLNVILENMFYTKESRNWPLFRRMVKFGEELKRQVEFLLDDDAILILPGQPGKPPKHNGTFLRMNNCGYTAIFNILELPVTAVPLGLGKNSRMPVGFQVVGKRMNDRFTIAVAELLSKRFGGWTAPCDVRVSST